MRTNPSASRAGADLGRNMKDYDLEQARLAGEIVLANALHIASMVDEAPTNAMGVGTTRIAVVQVPVLASGRFRWAASVSMAAVAADIVTAAVVASSDVSVLVPAYTNATAVPAANGMTDTGRGAQSQISSGGAGVGILINSPFGLVNPTQIAHDVQTIGTLAAGYRFAASGILYNFAGAPAGGYPVGTHVYISLNVTNSVANRACSGIVLSLEELA